MSKPKIISEDQHAAILNSLGTIKLSECDINRIENDSSNYSNTIFLLAGCNMSYTSLVFQCTVPNKLLPLGASASIVFSIGMGNDDHPCTNESLKFQLHKYFKDNIPIKRDTSNSSGYWKQISEFASYLTTSQLSIGDLPREVIHYVDMRGLPACNKEYAELARKLHPLQTKSNHIKTLKEQITTAKSALRDALRELEKEGYSDEDYLEDHINALNAKMKKIEEKLNRDKTKNEYTNTIASKQSAIDAAKASLDKVQKTILDETADISELQKKIAELEAQD